MSHLQNLKNQIRNLTWDLIEKYYNVDRSAPDILTSKHIGQFNAIDKIGEELADIVEALLVSAIKESKDNVEDWYTWD